MSTDVHTLSGAYALDALSPEEAAEFRRHLSECSVCRQEVRELRAAAARMGAVESLAPPQDLKARILAAADRTPQVPPPSPRARPAAAAPSSRPRWLARIGAAAAAVLLVGGGALGIRAAVDNGQPQLSAAAAQVFEARDARTVTVRTTNGGQLVVGVSPSRGRMAVDSRSLPELDSGHVYQLWAVRDGRATSKGVLSDPGAGAAMGVPTNGTEIAVTVEPRGGSPQPTTNPIAVVDPQSL